MLHVPRRCKVVRYWEYGVRRGVGVTARVAISMIPPNARLPLVARFVLPLSVCSECIVATAQLYVLDKAAVNVSGC